MEPAADFEFKHLLQRVQLTEGERPDIIVVTGGKEADATVERFTKFFGEVPGKWAAFGACKIGFGLFQRADGTKAEPLRVALASPVSKAGAERCGRESFFA